MRKRVGAALWRRLERLLRLLEEALSIAIIVGMSLGPAAGAIGVGWLLTRGSIPLALLAAAGLGATVAFGIGLARTRRKGRSRCEESIQDRVEEPKAAASSPLEQLGNAMITFHDFNPQRRRFDHW